MIGAQVSVQQQQKITSYVEIGRNEGAECLIGGERASVDGEFKDGYHFEPTVLKGHNKVRVLQEEIFGPVLAVTAFKDEAEALRIANDTLYGLVAGVWTRDAGRAYGLGRAIKAGVCLDQLLPPLPGRRERLQGLRHRPGDTQDDAGHHSQVKNLLVSYSPKPLGLF